MKAKHFRWGGRTLLCFFEQFVLRWQVCTHFLQVFSVGRIAISMEVAEVESERLPLLEENHQVGFGLKRNIQREIRCDFHSAAMKSHALSQTRCIGR